MKKFGKQNPSNYKRPVSGPQRTLSPAHINFDDSMDVSTIAGHSPISGMILSCIKLINSSLYLDDTSSLNENEDFANTTRMAVNVARQKYGAPPVELSEQLSSIAQRWAEKMAETGKLEHSPAEWRNFGRQTLGENYIAQFQVELTRYYF